MLGGRGGGKRQFRDTDLASEAETYENYKSSMKLIKQLNDEEVPYSDIVNPMLWSGQMRNEALLVSKRVHAPLKVGG